MKIIFKLLKTILFQVFYLDWQRIEYSPESIRENILQVLDQPTW